MRLQRYEDFSVLPNLSALFSVEPQKKAASVMLAAVLCGAVWLLDADEVGVRHFYLVTIHATVAYYGDGLAIGYALG